MYSSSPRCRRDVLPGFPIEPQPENEQAIPKIRSAGMPTPAKTAIHGKIRGVTIAPTLVPALKLPVASARSFFGNHSATHLRLAGNIRPRQNPRQSCYNKAGKRGGHCVSHRARLRRSSQPRNQCGVPGGQSAVQQGSSPTHNRLETQTPVCP